MWYAFIDAVLSETKKAVQLVIDGSPEWWPKSQIKIIESIVDYDDRQMVEAHHWLFVAKGVQPRCSEDLIGY